MQGEIGGDVEKSVCLCLDRWKEGCQSALALQLKFETRKTGSIQSGRLRAPGYGTRTVRFCLDLEAFHSDVDSYP